MLRRASLLTAIFGLFATTSFSACSGGSKESEFPDAGGCPKGAEQIAHMDWGLKDPHAAQVRAGLMGAQHLELLAVVLETDFLEACTALAKDLYATDKQLEGDDVEVGAEAAQACSVAAESLSKLRVIAGGNLTVKSSSAVCKVPMNAGDQCFKACDSAAKKPLLECMGATSGLCDGACSGQCSVEDESQCRGHCSGQCSGGCDSEFEGECRSKCEGECDGEKSMGECAGKCVGRCMEAARGTCGGVCSGACNSGACTIEAMGECGGVCAGTCDKKMKEPMCQGSLILPEMSVCQTDCETILLAETICSDASVEVSITEPENQEAAEHLTKTLKKHLPKLMNARGISLDPEKVNQAIKSTNVAVTTMKDALATPGLELSKKQKACAEDAEDKIAPATSSLTYAGQAADTARLLIDP